ncbi:MAG: elongation factor 1-beta [Candidatus Micrarchaeota archaeon]|nr:elongation factor 1-beta [Candidatus Micrarchaeota archaeon]
MGDVLVRFSIMPEDMEHFETLKENILKKVKSISIIKKYDIKEQDIAFGMKSIILNVVVPDDAGGADLIEQKLSEVKYLSSLEVTSMDRL